ncbi:NAD-dependent epimerase/dehydratase family protein [Peribacillus acanthi]|uniref:NAD-dependent epimerase/dehydratase family protein n=1 Tax=Peribacillus acanthi TaxID=2171554 RepID=UPI000D3E6FE7|nr:NAD-dependent epimerase/dehydratase family protein [Peribacillus acanthi]
MKVLVAGGYGFIGSFIAERLYKEGHDVYIVDNLSTGVAENLSFRHKSFILNVESEECETIFRSNSFDAVIFSVTNSNASSSYSNPTKDSLSSVIGLENFLHLSGKYNVPKFIFLSSAAVYNYQNEETMTETSEPRPSTVYGYHKLMGENLCNRWSETHGLKTVIFRLPNVYGPRDRKSKERGVISIFIEKILEQQVIHIFGDGDQIRDFIYVEDVSDAIYRSVISNISGVYNLSTNSPESINQLLFKLEDIHELPKSIYKGSRNGDINHSVLSNKKIALDLDWVPKYSLEEGLEKTFQWNYKQLSRKKKYSFKGILEWRKNLYKTYKFLVPFIENIIQFLIFAVLDYGTFQTNHLIDYKLVYVLMIGMFLGKTQAILACFLTVILYIYENLAHGREFVSLFLDNNTLSHIAMYLFFGLVLGYIMDKKNIALETLKEEYMSLHNKYEFLDEIFKETRKIKGQLQEQIMYTEDSVGKIFELASKLDSLEPEDIFNGSINMIEKIMKTKAVSIYLVSKNSDYLRLISKSNRGDLTIANSIRVSEDDYYYKVISEKKTVLNHHLEPNLPILMAPIITDGRVIGIVCLNEVNFERLTLYYQNLFEVVIRLISSSMTRAFEFVSVTHPNRYIHDTPILKPDYFTKIVESKRRAKEELNIPFNIVEVKHTDQLNEVLRKTRNALRETDVIGRDKNGDLWIILSNTTDKEANIVTQRLMNLGLSLRIAKEEELYV